MKFHLYKGKELVDEAVVMSADNVVYHLFSNLRETKYGIEAELRKKFKFVSKDRELVLIRSNEVIRQLNDNSENKKKALELVKKWNKEDEELL